MRAKILSRESVLGYIIAAVDILVIVIYYVW